MKSQYSVSLSRIVQELDLRVVYAADRYDTAQITSSDPNRCGLQLAGFYSYFDAARPQILGKAENAYLLQLSDEARRESLERFFSSGISVLIICHELTPMPECLELASAHQVNILCTNADTSEFMADLTGILNIHLAPRITMHGVLVEVHGEGLLITGDSGIGKSETALELVKRGHKLIADDAVEIKRTARTTLIGAAPPMIRYYMEVRGIGIIDTRNIFGIGAVKPACKLDLVVDLRVWSKDNPYDKDRMGLEQEYQEILGVKMPRTTIPVLPGRNLAVILEIAAINHRQKKMGYNAAQTLLEKHDNAIDEDIGWLSL
ncbi:MAG: HPr(Ser) kinase/phosphatase [Clostridiales bacterium]|nr:HPr(Ser) kinase/phosphatase [Clostridiales bacterium]